ncbi:hypothetical protein PAXRUDRAFT_153670, partial [Paxillus rubicundulus Ve08.2h10]
FDHLHFSWYNHYATSVSPTPYIFMIDYHLTLRDSKGENAPTLTHPFYLKKGHTNNSQTIPYLSAETFKHKSLYHNLEEVYNRLFEWLEMMTKNYLPSEYEVLVQLVPVLPSKATFLTLPFLSFPSSSTSICEAHQDAKDKGLCLVLPIRNFKGGSLLLKEQGLVLNLANGNFMVFRSAETMHFNLDYEGSQEFFMLHTDRTMDKWEERRNG